jgi:GTP-binding protein
VPEYRSLANMLLKDNKKTILVVNKSDTALAKENMYEFERLGFKSIVSISAQHGVGIADLLDELLAQLPTPVEYEQEEDALCRVVIVGKPNVGKSSLMNLLLKKERSIVSNIAGTTREPVKERIKFHEDIIQLVDTPGIRRKRGVNETIEQMMVKTAFKAVDQADVVLLVVDASEARLVDQELKLAFYVFEQELKGLIILFNKDDLMDDVKRADLAFQLEPYAHLLDKVVQIRTSCVTSKNVGKLMNIVNEVCQRYTQRFSDDDLTFMFKSALTERPLYRNQRPLTIHKAKQIKTAPITIELLVNESAWFGPSQLAFFERILRTNVDLRGVPVKFVTRKRG